MKPANPALDPGAAALALPVAPPLAARATMPLIERLVDFFGARWLDDATVAAWAARPGDHVLLLAGEQNRVPQGLDVAVVLPELRREFSHCFDIGVAARPDEDALAARFGVQRWPALVFLRDGQYVATIVGMYDWTVFVDKVAQVLAAAPTKAPARIVPLVLTGADRACH